MLDQRANSRANDRKGRSGSFDGGVAGALEGEDEDIAYDDLGPNEKYQVLQHLYEEYHRDPENFPEDQRILLEQELKELFEQGEFEGEEEEPDDDRLKMEGHINYPNDLPAKKEEDEELQNLEGEGDDHDDEMYMKEILR